MGYRLRVIIPFKGVRAEVAADAYVQESAQVIGDVSIGPASSIWFCVVLRGDVNYIRIGARSSIQDGSVVHVSSKGLPTVIGDDVTVGHKALLHACTIGDRVLIGSGAIVLDGAEIPSECLVGAGSLVVPGSKFAPRQLILGAPARAVRELAQEEIASLVSSAARYVAHAAEYRKAGIP